MSRIVCHFSCGAASAVATKLILGEYPKQQVAIYNAFIQEEHEDNRRFLADCEKWFDHPIIVVRDEIYNASAIEVFRRKRFLANGLFGAPCSKALKRDVLNAQAYFGDINILGFTADPKEIVRYEKYLDNNPTVKVKVPLIERRLSKSNCLSIIERAGIALPLMYRLGYSNANCIGCVKGGQGYWNKIREDFPTQFNILADVQEMIGPGAYIFRNRETGERFSLRDNPLDAGTHDEVLPECGSICMSAEDELE